MNLYKTYSVIGRLATCVNLSKSIDLKGKSIVDVGCSNGLMCNLLEGEKPKRYVGVDPSQGAVTIAKKNNLKAAFYQGTAGNLPLKNNNFDIALMFDVIEHVPKNGEIEALCEVNRVLKKKGTLLLSTPNDNFFTNILDPAWYLGHRHYTPERVKKFLKESGFKVISIEVRGNLWFSLYLILLYINKWILKNKNFKNNFIEKMDDKGFKSEGTHTIFVRAEKL